MNITEYFGLRPHQISAFEAIRKNNKGSIICPTGTGKTQIFTASISELLLNSDEAKTVIILSHRITLNSQHRRKICSYLHDLGIKFNCVVNDSGNDDTLTDANGKSFLASEHSLISTTNSSEIKDFVKLTKLSNKNVIIFSTYQSLDKIVKIESDMTICDEAHNLEGSPKSGSNQANIIDTYKAASVNWNRCYLFTATPRIGKKSTNGSKIGLLFESSDDEDSIPEMYIETIGLFGKVLYEFSPKEAIDKCEILPPRLHLIERINHNYDINFKSNIGMLAESICSSFLKHNTIVSKDSNRFLNAKMLVTCSGIESIKEIVSNEKIKQFGKEHDVLICAICSDYCVWNNLNVDRKTFMDNLANLDSPTADSQKVILFHVRILTEGIDIPTLTGVMLFTDKTATSFTQLVGRCARLFGTDRRNLYNGYIKISDARRQFLKKYAWIIVPDFVKTVDITFVEKLIEKIYLTYNPERDFLVLHERGDSSEEISADSLLSVDESVDVDNVRFLIRQKIKSSLFDAFIEWDDSSEDYYAEY